jgi:hypothetical protein
MSDESDDNPATGIPSLHDEDMRFTIPTAIRILASTHIISYQRGLLVVPPRISKEVEPWEDHPIMQALLKRITVKWRLHRDNLSPDLLLPKAQKVATTPEHLHGATAWLLNPQTVHIGTLSVNYCPSPVATYAWLSSWQSSLGKLHPDNIHRWIERWLHVYPSLHLEARGTSRPPSATCMWAQWLTQLAHSRLSQDSDDRPGSASPVAISEFLRRRMEVTDVMTRPLLREYLEDLNNTTTYAIQTPSRTKLIATLLALDNAPRPTCPPPIQSHYWRALLPETPIWHWDQTPTGAALQSTHELEVTPFSPTTLMSLGAALSSTKIVHTLFSTQP